MLGKVGAEQQKVAVATGADSTLVLETEALSESEDDASAAPKADDQSAAGTSAGPDDAAIEAARQRRANRRGKKR